MGAQLRACGRICWSCDSGPLSNTNLSSTLVTSPSADDDPLGYLSCLSEFPDFGGSAPVCPTPPQKPKSGPITIDVLQGEWLGSNGASINVAGTSVFLNGLPLSGHKVELFDDGAVSGIGRLWQLKGWVGDGGIEFYASHSRENIEFAPKNTWTRRDSAEPWAERMKLLGYAGTAANPLNRGIEGCIPGTLAQDMPTPSDDEAVELLQKLINQWREPELLAVRSCEVVPDFINRENTGVGVELVHFIATSIKEHGFKKRKGTMGHDIPVVVREPPGSAFHAEALGAWKGKVAEEDGFPPVRIRSDQVMFTSLGNGHFFQALNLYDCGCVAIHGTWIYTVGQDSDLAEAISKGVLSIVLTHTTPRPVRAKIAQLLNSKREFLWNLHDDGTVELTTMEENTTYCKQFECMSKFLDAVTVDSLVRSHLGVRDSKRIQG